MHIVLERVELCHRTPQFHGWLEGLELIKTIGINNIYDRILFLTDVLIDGLQSRNVQIYTTLDNRDERSAILICSFEMTQEMKLFQKHLQKMVSS